ncbi:hypothetical protein [Devosia sp.]|uniref:hypothetical protein n=1 Tax=Devosia sp. TaxID=1871048 RepID=UPI002FC87A3E
MIRFIAIALTALLLGAGAAMPAQAQSFGFGIFFGDEASDFYPERITCMTDRQIRDAVAARGYTNIYLNVAMEKNIQVRATRDGWVYLLDFNFCSGRIEGRQQLRPAG